MAKKTVTKSSIKKGYQEYLLTEGEVPATVRILTKQIKISDEDFFNHYGSLSAVETSIWHDYFTSTLQVVHKDPDFAEMSSREKHLSFLFTLLEVMRKDRSYILFRLQDKKLHQLPKELTQTKRIILDGDTDWVNSFEFLPGKAQEYTQKSYQQVLWSHCIAMILFWVKDGSPNGSDTDVFIEKTTRTAFDVGELPALESIVDLSKFFLQKMGVSKVS